MNAQKIPISVNCRVLLELIEASGEREQRMLVLVATRQADFQSGFLDENTPLGQALVSHYAGDVVPYELGGLKEVRILMVEPEGEGISSEAAEKRRAAVHKAEAQSEITNQMIFSTASGSKWGDYEVNMDKLLDEDETDK
jgi:hypothetical protein